MLMDVKKLIIICATQRCGSTMVVEDMRNTQVLGNPEEYFIPWDPGNDGVNWIDNLETIAKKASSSNGVVAIKVMSNQLRKIEQCLEHADFVFEELAGSEGVFPRFRALTKNAYYIHIRRDNLLRQAISRSMSRQTGINHAVPNSSVEHFAGNLLKGYTEKYNEKANYRHEELEGEMFNIVNENIRWEAFYSSWGINNPLTLRYEEICKNGTLYIDRVSRYVDVEVKQRDSERKMVKLSNKKNEQWYDSYLESVL